MNYKLMNFNIPVYLKERLDYIATYKHISRTAILNLLVDRYCQTEMISIENERSGQGTLPVRNNHTPIDLDLPLAPKFTNWDYDPFLLEEL